MQHSFAISGPSPISVAAHANLDSSSKSQSASVHRSIVCSIENKPDLHQRLLSGKDVSPNLEESLKGQNKVHLSPITQKPLFPAPLRFLWFHDNRKHHDSVTHAAPVRQVDQQDEFKLVNLTGRRRLIENPPSGMTPGNDESIGSTLKDPKAEDQGQSNEKNAGGFDIGLLWKGFRTETKPGTDPKLLYTEVAQSDSESNSRVADERRKSKLPKASDRDHTGLNGAKNRVAGFSAECILDEQDFMDWNNSIREQGGSAAAAQNLKAIRGSTRCSECGACSSEIGCDFEVSDGRKVVQDATSLRKYLVKAPIEELRTSSFSSVLCDLAYEIKKIDMEDLFRKLGLVMVTSSVAQKKTIQKAEKTKANCSAGGSTQKITRVEADKKNDANMINSAYGLAAAAAAYIQSQSSFLIPMVSSISNANTSIKEVTVLSESSPSNLSSENHLGTSDSNPIALSKASLENLGEPANLAFEVVTDLRQGAETELGENSKSCKEKTGARDNDLESVGGSPATKEMIREGKQMERDKENDNPLEIKKSPSANESCPCEWFICDDPSVHTRYIVIQGSDSFASWQTNISFDPVLFEKPEFKVVVHRGIYEAAKALYKSISPFVHSFMQKHGSSSARIALTGHSLGGSLATLLMLMLKIRDDIPSDVLKPVYTFGSPSIMCGGDTLLTRLGLSRMHVRQVMMHRDLVPRAFACDYPNHVADILFRISESFRDHPCLLNQRLIYAPMGTALILQPDKDQSPFHPSLPAESGLFYVQHPFHSSATCTITKKAMDAEVRGVIRSFLNSPHPLEILSDPGSYGPDGFISRDHNPSNYCKALHGIFRLHKLRIRRIRQAQRRHDWLPLIAGDFSTAQPNIGSSPLSESDLLRIGMSSVFSKPNSSPSNSKNSMKKRRGRRSGRLTPAMLSNNDGSLLNSHPI